MELDEKRELAFQYLHESMEQEAKKTVFELILKDAEFRQCLKEEVELMNRMKRLRPYMLPTAENKSQLLVAIQSHAKAGVPLRLVSAADEPEWLRFSEWALRLLLPPIIYPIMRILQRRVFQ